VAHHGHFLLFHAIKWLSSMLWCLISLNALRMSKPS
jgi:hypothetical protein